MGKNQSASGLTNIIQYDNNGNVSFVSGSTTLMQISSSGAITTTGVISGSNALSASFSLNSGLLNSTGSVGFATTGSLLTVSSSQQQISASQQQMSASLLILTASFNAVSSSYTALSGSYNTFSGSNSEILTAVSSSNQQLSASYISLSGSYNTFSGSASTRVTQIENVYATTGSNSFRATQSITGSLTVTGQIIAQTINVQQVTSSIIYSSGSNVFGCDLNSRQTFTGSVLITGSLTIAGASSATSYSGATIFGSTIACSPIGCFATSCATSFIGGTMSGTTIYGSTAVCSPVGKFTTCLDLGGALTGTSATFANRVCTAGLTVTDDIYFGIGAGAYEQMTLCYSGYNSASPITTLMPKTAPGSGAITTMLLLKSNGLGGGTGCNHMGLNVQSDTYLATCNGKVGIGTCSPSAILDSQTNSGAGNILNSATDVVARFGNINTNPGNHYGSGLQVYQGTGTLGSGYAAGFLNVSNNLATSQNVNTLALIAPSGMSGGLRFYANDSSADIRYYTSNTERIRITSTGIACFDCTVCAYSFASPTPSLTRNNLNIDRATKVITSFNATASGARWLRVGCFDARTTYLMSFGTTGNYYTPGSTTFLMFRDWGNGFFTSTLGKLGEQYVTCARFQSDNVGSQYALEVWMNSITADQLNGVLVYSAATLAGNPDSILMCLGSYGTSLANAANTSTAIAL